MPAFGRRKRTKGRWRTTLLLATALATVADSAVDVHGALPAAPVVTVAPQPPKPTKHKSKKHRKNHKKRDKKEKPESIEDMIEKEVGKHADDALRIAFCESRFDTNDVSS